MTTMAEPKTLAQIEAMVRALGWDDIEYVPGALNRDRPGDFNPIGITNHITAGGLGNRSELTYINDIINGDKSVPAKANVVTAPDGTLWLNAFGNTNHCLYYGDTAYRLTRDGTWPTYSGSVNARGGKTKWSLYTYGNEMIAASKPTAIQRKVSVIWSAAMTILHGWKSVTHGHGEVAHDRGFGDPNLDMGLFRRDVMGLVAEYKRGSTAPDPAAPSKPAPEPEDDMTVSRIVVPDPKTAVRLPINVPAGRWTPLGVGNQGWQTLVGNASKPLFLDGETALTVQLPDPGTVLRIRHFAFDAKGKRVHTWPEQTFAGVWEVARSLATQLNPGHRLGVEIHVSKPSRVIKARTELKIITNR